MPFREQDFQELCARCKGAAAAHCLRCGIPLCAEHEHGASERCSACEKQFDELIERRQRAPVRWSVVGLSGAIAAVLLTGGAAIGALGWIELLAVLFGLLLVWYSGVGQALRERRLPSAAEVKLLRRRFLEEEARRLLPGKHSERPELPPPGDAGENGLGHAKRSP